MIETERLLLRKPTVEDADDLLAYIADPEVMRWVGGRTGDRAHAVATIERWLLRWEENGIGPFVLVRGDRVLGRAGFRVWDRSSWQVSSYADAGERSVAELGWALARVHWGQGYATEAARALRDWVHAERGVRELISLIAPENVRSQRVAEKLGAVPAETVDVGGDQAVVWRHPLGHEPAR